MKKTNLPDTETSVSKGFPIVAIGASSGGLEAMTDLLRSIQEKTGMAFLYLQYTGGEQTGDMLVKLREATSMTVEEGRHDVRLAPDTIYVIPADPEVQVVDGVLQLTRLNPRRKDQRLIDRFFTGLARSCKTGVLGVLLSGEEEDGAAGLKAIKIAGGFTFAQDETAAFDEMPKSAMTAGVVDLVLSPSEIGQELSKLGGQADAFSEMQIGNK